VSADLPREAIYAAKRSASSNFSADEIVVIKFRVRVLALIYQIANVIQTFATLIRRDVNLTFRVRKTCGRACEQLAITRVRPSAFFLSVQLSFPFYALNAEFVRSEREIRGKFRSGIALFHGGRVLFSRARTRIFLILGRISGKVSSYELIKYSARRSPA